MDENKKDLEGVHSFGSIGYFLQKKDDAEQTEGILRPCGYRTAFIRETKGREDFLRNMGPTDFEGLSMVLVDISGIKGAAFEIVQEVVFRCPETCKVLVLGERNDVFLYRSLMTAGATDYVIKPVPGAMLIRSVAKMLGQGDTGSTNSYTVAFYATHAGCGAGLMTAGVSSLLAERFHRSTACADTDFASGTVGSHLGIDAPGNLPDLLDAGDRLDASLIEMVVNKLSDNLSLLNGRNPLRVPSANDRVSAQKIVDTLSRHRTYQIWRVAGSGALSLEVMKRANNVYIVTTGTFASAANAQYMVDWLRQHNPKAIVSQIFNSAAPDQPISPKQMEEVTGLQNKLTIPYMRKLASDLASAKPLSKENHSFYSICDFLVADIRGQGNKKKEKGWISGLFG
jgi:pilus assembly protein CpaE